MPPLVTPGMLAAVRNIGNMGLESLATIERSVQVENDFGSEHQWSTIATNVPCWVRAMGLSASIGSTAYRETVLGAFRIHFEVGTDVDHGDRVTVGAETFEVIDVNLENTIQVFTTALAKKVE